MDGLGLETKAPLSTGTQMPIIGLGTWQSDDAADTVNKALGLGYRLIDTSSDYGTQPGVGRGIRESGIAREEIFLSTKAEETDDSYKRTKSNLEELELEYIDLMLIHRPPSEGIGTSLWEGLIRAKDEGLTKDIGVSNYSVSKIEDLIDATAVAPVVNQIEWSPFGHSREMMEYCIKKKIIIQAYSPLTRGKKFDDQTLQRIADKYGKSPAQILIRWNLQYRTLPIVKAESTKHLEENIDVFNFEISEADMDALNGLNEEYSSFGGKPPYFE